ncbi:mitogen-activated protein kinase kinase kinase 18-like [Camellia sinensis]|uniref:mitogen-activated protein kinase kinase kinase 18-like n=1 Tax=Camellia sinensis TaxID=4442 RepID=UPI001036272A|nr:mitogen-activated protein kinase kinase kinase 18-like [Camellia sinensis]
MEWTRGPTIGVGATATVSIATTTSGDRFAVKSSELSRSKFLQKEQHFLSKLSSPHIIQYMGFEITHEFNNQPMYNLFMEYVPAGTISDELKRHGGSFTESKIKSYTHQILQGLNYLHLNGLVHCDIKGQNILMGRDGLKIADLGCARLAEHGGDTVFSGTPVFMAPEVVSGEGQGFPADIWALGCTVIEMATGSPPWPEVNDPVSALYRIGFSGDIPEFPRWFSETAKDFLSKCLKRDWRERWTAKELLQHPFFEELNCGKSDEFGENSPKTVLDQDFWDSSMEVEAPLNLTHIDSSPSDSPSERFNRLIGSDSNLPNWTCDEDWVTIRSNNGIEESKKFQEQSKNMDTEEKRLIETELYMFSGAYYHCDSIVSDDWLAEWSVEVMISVIECLCVCIDFVKLCVSVSNVNESFVLVQFEVLSLSLSLSFYFCVCFIVF